MLRSLYSAVAGTRSHQVRMDVIANNIANVNTTAFKAGRASFQEVLAQTLRAGYGPVSSGRGSINPMQVGIGSAIKYIDQNFTPGNLENTGKFTDVAIEGDGFFVVSDGTKNMYTRDGHFDVGSDGFLEAASTGVKVQGWMADVNGQIDKTKPISNLKFDLGNQKIVKATTSMVLAGNLDADSVSLYGPRTAEVSSSDLAAGTLTSTTGTDRLPDNVTVEVNPGADADDPATADINEANPYLTVRVGGEIAFQGNATGPDANGMYSLDIPADGSTTPAWPGMTFKAAIADPSVSATHNFSKPDSYTQSLTVYDSVGNGHSLNATFTKAADSTWTYTITDENGNSVLTDPDDNELKFSGSGSLVSPTTSKKCQFNPGNGADRMEFTVDLTKLTQYASTTSAKMESQDGYPVGTLDSFTVGPQGVVTGVYSNQQTLVLGQIAVASFANPGGLIKVGDSCFDATLSSGQPSIGGADSDGKGAIKAMSLEMSNVDLSQEFTDMIVTQRGFQANSKVITTSDEILQDLMNLKR